MFLLKQFINDEERGFTLYTFFDAIKKLNIEIDLIDLLHCFGDEK